MKEIATTAQRNQCRIIVEMHDGYDINQFTNDIKTRVDAVSSLPENTEPPRVSLLTNVNMMMFISLEGRRGYRPKQTQQFSQERRKNRT